MDYHLAFLIRRHLRCPFRKSKKKSANIDSSNTEKILALFDEGEWVEATPNCGYDFVFNYNGDMYRYHSECGTFYSLTDKQSLELGETSQAEVNDILESLFN